jgi:4-hydroxyphenylpyruvate dioxygenase-like putative hemolysin
VPNDGGRMTERGPQLHHVVFAVAMERHDAVAQMFNDLGFTLQPVELSELGLRIHLDWDGGVELVSPIAGSTAAVAQSVNEFLDQNGDGVYTVVLKVPGAAAAESVAERYGATIRYRQRLEGDGTHLEEIDLSVFDLPLTLLDTSLP